MEQQHAYRDSGNIQRTKYSWKIQSALHIEESTKPISSIRWITNVQVFEYKNQAGSSSRWL